MRAALDNKVQLRPITYESTLHGDYFRMSQTQLVRLISVLSQYCVISSRAETVRIAEFFPTNFFYPARFLFADV